MVLHLYIMDILDPLPDLGPLFHVFKLISSGLEDFNGGVPCLLFNIELLLQLYVLLLKLLSSQGL